MISPVNSFLTNSLSPGMVVPLTHSSRGKTGSVPSKRAPNVSADLTPAAVRLSEENLDFARSSVTTTSTELEFKLEFTSSSLERLSAEGYYAEASQSLSLALRYTFEREITIEARTQVRTFEASLDIQVSRLQYSAASALTRKKDIIALVRRLLNDISRVAANDDKGLGDVVIDRDDFLDIAAVDSGRLANKLEALIQLTVMLAHLKQLLADEAAVVVILDAQPKESGGLTVVEFEERLEIFHLAIRDITADSAPPEDGSRLESTTVKAGAGEGTPPAEELEDASASL